MTMSSLNISLPKTLKAYIEKRVKSGDWGTPSEYVRELIRRDKERQLSSEMDKANAPQPKRRRRQPSQRVQSGLRVYEEMVAKKREAENT
jgi:putative addiction module CopG family antidote